MWGETPIPFNEQQHIYVLIKVLSPPILYPLVQEHVGSTNQGSSNRTSVVLMVSNNHPMKNKDSQERTKETNREVREG